MKSTYLFCLVFLLQGCYSASMMQTAKPLEKGQHELSTGLVGYSLENSIDEDYSMKNSPIVGVDIMYRSGLTKNTDLGVSFAPSATVGHLRADLKYNFYQSSNESVFVSSLFSIEANNLRYIGSGGQDDFFIANGLGLVASFNHQKYFYPFLYQKFTLGLTDIGVFSRYNINTPPTDFVNYLHHMHYIGGAGFRYQFKHRPRMQLISDISYHASRKTRYYNYEGFSGNDIEMMLSKSIDRYINYQFTFGLSFYLGKKIPTVKESIPEKKRSLMSSHENSKFKISTNLISPFIQFNGLPRINGWALTYRFLSSSRDVSIEPEYQVSNYFAIALPIYIGLTRMNKNAVSPTLFSSWSYTDSIETPSLEYIQTNYKRRIDLIGQLGIQGKWYPWGIKKAEKSKIQPFLSSAMHLAIYDIYSFEFGQTWDSTSLAEFDESDSESFNVPAIGVGSHKTIVLRGEFLVGFEKKLSSSFGITYSLGYSTRRMYFNDATDRIYTREEGGQYELAESFDFPGKDVLNVDQNGFFINRFQLTYYIKKKRIND